MSPPCSIPTKTTVLVIGGGPAGSYAASALAREGVDVTLLEAEKFPRYHIGESMLAAIRFFFRFIDLEKTFDDYGFQKKYGATFKITQDKEAFTNFSASLGPGGHSWNVVRSEADNLIFQHAGKQGAHIFDATKVTDIEFVPEVSEGFDVESRLANPGRPVSATWSRKNGTTGKVEFEYLIDASGRAGVMSTKYLKNRRLNEGLKNIANWTYWKGATTYAEDTERANSPFFEATRDGSGWVWAIPLHTGQLSCGVVMRQDIFFAKKKEQGSPPPEELYRECLKLAPGISKMLENAEIVSNIKLTFSWVASDWSYSANAYAGPNFRIAGDAGCFIDPYFSSGVHLALNGALSAATTIQAVRRGDCTELEAAKWHTTRITEAYTRFLLTVLVVLRQIRAQGKALLSDQLEEGFDKAFGFIQPVIQGVADTEANDLSIAKKSNDSVGFAIERMKVSATEDEKNAIVEKMQNAGDRPEELESLSTEEFQVLEEMVGKQIETTKTEKDLSGFTGDVINGLAPKVERGSLTLVRV